MDQFLNSIRNLQSLTTITYQKKILSQVISCLKGDYQIELKENSLLLLIFLRDHITKELSKEDKLLSLLKQKCLNEQDSLNQISLECVKYFGTVSQISKYKEFLDQLIETNIIIPNSYKIIDQVLQYKGITIEQSKLQEYHQITYDHQLDIQAIDELIENREKIKDQEIFNIYKSAFEKRIHQIQELLKFIDIFTQQQIIELQTTLNLEQQYIKKINQLQSEPKQQIHHKPKPTPILVIENPSSERSNQNTPQINPFIKSQNELRDQLHQLLQQYADYQLAPKNSYGQIVKDRLNIQMEQKQLNKLKKACIRNKQKLFDSHDLQIGVTKKLIIKEELNNVFLQLNFFIGNKQSKAIEDCEMLFEEPRGLRFWLSNHLQNSIEGRKQIKLSCLVANEHLLFEPIKGQFTWQDNVQKYEAIFMVPCLLNQFMNFVPTSKEAFKMMWRKNREFCHRSEEFQLNQKIIKSVLDFKKYIPNLCYLVSLKDFVDGKDLKLGGEFTLNNERIEYVNDNKSNRIIQWCFNSEMFCFHIIKYLMKIIGQQILSTWYSTNYRYRAWQHNDVEGEAYIFGRRMSSKEDVQKKVNTTIRFTYRDGFIPYKTFDTDSGWGCIIRVGQMMIAQLIKRHLKKFYQVDLFQITGLLKEVLQQFNDNDDYESLQQYIQQYKHGLSIQRIMRVAEKICQKHPGEWYSPNEIVQIIHQILLDNKIPFLYSLGFVPLYDSQIDLKLIFQEMSMNDNCTCGKNLFQMDQLIKELDKLQIGEMSDIIEVMPENNQIHQIQMPDFSIEDKKTIENKIKKYICQDCFQIRRATAVCLLSRIGCDEPNPEYITVIKSFMCKPYFSGMLGGRPREANFITGFSDDKFIVLDPHLIQSANMNEQEYIQSCFPAEVMYLKESELDCSLGLIFYLNDLKDVIQLIYDVLESKSTSFFSFAFQMNNQYSGIRYKQQQILIEEQKKNYNLKTAQLLEMSTLGDDIDSSFETL